MLRKSQGKTTRRKPQGCLFPPPGNTWVERHVAGSNLDTVVEPRLEVTVGKPVAEALPLVELVVLVELHDSDYERPYPCEDLPKQRCL